MLVACQRLVKPFVFHRPKPQPFFRLRSQPPSPASFYPGRWAWSGGSKSFRFQLREQDHVADAFLAEKHHAEPVYTDADAAGGRHAVFECDEKILVQLLLFT